MHVSFPWGPSYIRKERRQDSHFKISLVQKAKGTINALFPIGSVPHSIVQ